MKNIFLVLLMAACQHTQAPSKSATGYLDVVDSNRTAWGWAYVPSMLPNSSMVEVKIDTQFAGLVTANDVREDLNKTLKITGNHGWHFEIPDVFKDGVSHDLSAYGIGADGIQRLLSGSPKSFLFEKPPEPPQHVDPASFSVAQLRDLQGDLMLWVPELKPNYVDGKDPVTGMNQKSDAGSTPRGIAAGWIWSLMIDRYPADKREIIYQMTLAQGYTHFAIQVTQCQKDAGYHGLFPVSDSDCVGYADKLNTILQELWDHKIIPVCTGVSPTDKAQDGLNKSLCRVVLTDWDNSAQADCRIKAIGETFPNAQLIYELPSGSVTPDRDECSQSPFPTTGGEWIRNIQKKYPNFFAVAYETDSPEDISVDAARINQAHAWFRDVQEIRFETDTYWKFWDNLDVNTQKAFNDKLQNTVPYLKGYMSGGSSHNPPNGGGTGGGFAGSLDPHNINWLHIAGGFQDWLETTHINLISISPTGIHIELDNGKPDSWPDTADRPGMGPLLFSMGIAENIGGQWYASAPIQLWRGLQESGGDITIQNVGDGRGQIQANWFYDSGRWGPLANYQPKPGEIIGLFICSGDCRDANPSYSPVHERSDIILIKLPNPGETVVYKK